MSRTPTLPSSSFKQWVGITLSLIGAVIASIFWIQSYGGAHYYSEIAGENLEAELQEVKADIRLIRDQNNDIILMLGRIEGRLESNE